MKKNEKKVIVGTIPATAKKTDAQTAMVTIAEAILPKAKPEAEEPTPKPEAVQSEPAAASEVAARKTPAGELFPDPAKQQAETVLKLSRRIEELEQQLRREPQTIEERIMYYKRKQELTERYERFTEQVARLDELREKVAETNADADDFTDTREKYRLQLFVPHSYRDEAALTITNDTLIDSILDLLKVRMENKAAELKAEISA